MTSFERVLLAIFGFIVLFVGLAESADPALECEVAMEVMADGSPIRGGDVTVGPMQER